jgi:chromosome segregation ATPase
MTARLTISQLHLDGHNGTATYRFKTGLNVVHGETGSGKSSLLELIKYSLGGRGVLSEASEEGLRHAATTLRLSHETLAFRRKVGTNVIEVSEADGTPVETVASSEGGSKKLRKASDLLLERSGLPSVRLAAKTTTKIERLSFWDFYDYVYLPQSEIDRSVVRHLDNNKDRKRKAVFELLLGITNERVEELRVEEAESRERLNQLRADLTRIDQFVAELDVPSPEQMATSGRELREKMTEAERRVSDLRDKAREATSTLADRQRHVSQLAAQVRNLALETTELDERIRRRRAFRHQLETDRERLVRAGTATALLGTLEVTQCPRCLQAVAPDPEDTSHCYVCRQDEPVEGPEGDTHSGVSDDEFVELDEQLAETDALMTLDMRSLEEASARLRAFEAVHREAAADLDRAVEQFVSPRYEEIAVASQRVGELRARFEALRDHEILWRRHAQMHEELDVLTKRVEALQEEIDAERAKATRAGGRIDELSEIFDEIVRQIDMPWYDSDQPARIDTKNYLPRVNGVDFVTLTRL